MDCKRALEHCKAEFDLRAKTFRKSATANDWTHLMRAMMALQQAQQLRAHDAEDRDFCASLGAIPMGEWCERIVQHRCQCSIAEALEFGSTGKRPRNWGER